MRIAHLLIAMMLALFVLLQCCISWSWCTLLQPKSVYPFQVPSIGHKPRNRLKEVNVDCNITLKGKTAYYFAWIMPHLSTINYPVFGII